MRYTPIRSDIWIDEEVEQLSPEGKLLYVYLLTNPYSNLAGYYQIIPRHIASDLKIEEEKILPILLDQKKLWKYDPDTRQILIPSYLKYNKVGGEKQIKALNSQIKGLSKCELLKYFLHGVVKNCGEDSIKYFDKDILTYCHTNCKEQRDATEYTLYRLINIYLFN